MEEQYIETHKTWNKIAELYEDKFMDLTLYNNSYEKFCDLLPKEKATILEVGCGPGNIIRHLTTLHSKLDILATDVSKNMIEIAKKNNPTAEVKLLDCREINSLSNQFDGIVSGFTLPYLNQEDGGKFIEDSSMKLRKNGILYLSLVTGNYDQSGFISGSSGDRTFFYYHQLDWVLKQFEQNNFKVVHNMEVVFSRDNREDEKHTILIAKKAGNENM